MSQILEPGEILDEGQVNFTGWTVTLFGHYDLGATFDFHALGVVTFQMRQIELRSIDKHDNVGILLNGPRFTKVGQLGPLVAAARLNHARQL